MTLDVLILGAGISGLSTAWKLKKENPSIKLKIIDRASRVGGSIQSWRSPSGQLYEMGPRSFRDDPKIRALLSDLGLDDQVIPASKMARKRYLLKDGKCLPIRSLGVSFFLKAIYQSLLSSREFVDDESVYDFFSKRYGDQFATFFADSLVTGIYAADSKTLSMKCAFPGLFKSGSLIKSFVKNRTKLLTLKSGLSSIPEALYSRLKDDIELETDVIRVLENGEVQTSRGSVFAQRVISTLPRPDLVPYTSVTVVVCGFEKPGLLPSGFGVLAAKISHADLLGVVFDSSVFPEQSTTMPSRCTFMFGGARSPHFSDLSDSQIMQHVQTSLREYFNVSEHPSEFKIWRAKAAIPAFPVGFANIRERMQIEGSVTNSGSWMSGVSLSDCIYN